MSTIKELNERKNELCALIEIIIETKRMIPGTYKEVYRKCGKSYCWCAKEKKGHPFKRITWSENGKPRSKAIPKEDVSWVKIITSHYNSLKVYRQKLRKCVREIADLLDKYEAQIIKETRKEKSY